MVGTHVVTLHLRRRHAWSCATRPTARRLCARARCWRPSGCPAATACSA
ncbi:MAG: hypothetical protein WKG07_44435 [Hymenobacter sp.]